MQVTRIRHEAEWDSLESDWNCLARGVPFRAWAWMRNWWRHFSDDNQLFVLTVRDDGGTLVGVAPWYLANSASKGRALRFIASGQVCSDYLSLLATEAHEDAVISAIASWLIAANRGRQNGDTSNETPIPVGDSDRWDLLELDGISATDRPTAKLIEQLVEQGCVVNRREGLNCWRIELPDTWDAYLGTMSKSHRKQIRRVENRMLDSGRAVLHTIESLDDHHRAMQTLVDLHQRRRLSLNQPGCFADAKFDGFLHAAAADLLKTSQLELQILELDGTPAAAEFHLVGNGVVYAYQAGVDPERLDDEPGRIMNVAVIKRAIENQYRAFDFLRGDEPYKAHWRAEPQSLVQLRVVPTHVAARVRYGVWLAGDAMKNLLRGSLNLAGMH
ncbi:MAG: GNAT family N-acetyltransferase [Pirellulaceae bacterium]